MKYMIGGIILVAIAFFVYASNDNKKDIARIEENKQQYIDQQNMDVKVAELKAKIDMRDSDALKIVESPKIQVEDQKFYTNLYSKWDDAIKVADATARVSLAAPVKDLQAIKRDLSAKVVKTYCEEAFKSSLSLSYDYAIDSFLSFMRNDETEAKKNLSLSSSHMNDANVLLDYCKAS